MLTISISRFKAECLGLLKSVNSSGEPIAVTLRGKTVAIVNAPSPVASNETSVAKTLAALHPLLLVEEKEFEAPHRTDRPLPANFPTE